ncbi:MAG: glycosyltransferase family 39 protein [Crocosphaera sp.]|nr:glycosyltransferase family 39 protein [Crocosphaera sp.]
MKSLKEYDLTLGQYSNPIIIGILLIGLLLRLYGINFGLPYLYNPDEPNRIRVVFRILSTQDLNPHWFGHPATTVIYLLVLSYGLMFVGGRFLGIFNSSEAFLEFYRQDPSIFYLTGRLWSAFFGVVTIWFVYLIATKIFNKTVGLISAFLVAIIPLHVEVSKIARMDTLMPFLLLISFYYCLKILEKDSLINYFKASFFLGLAIATKYPAIVFLLTIILTYILIKGWKVQGYLKPVSSVLACTSGAFIASPFLFLDFNQVLIDISQENRSSHLGATGEGFINNLIWYFQNPLTQSFTVFGLLLISLGCLSLFFCNYDKLFLLISFPSLFLLFISLLNLRWERWIIPMIPFLCIFLAYSIYRICKFLELRFNYSLGLFLILVMLTLISSPLLHKDIIQGYKMSGVDTRTFAGGWMLKNIPENSSILVEDYTPQLPKMSFQFFEVKSHKNGTIKKFNPQRSSHATFYPSGTLGDLKSVEEISKHNIEYIVMGNYYDRYLLEKNRYPKIVKRYEDIIESGELIYETKKNNEVRQGTTIRIYKVSEK